MQPQQQPNRLAAVILIGLALWMFRPWESMSIEPTPVKPDPAVRGEEAYWSRLAEFVERYPDRFADTDRVYKVAEELKAMGCVSSLDRVSSYAEKMQTIDSGNRTEVIRRLKGH